MLVSGVVNEGNSNEKGPGLPGHIAAESRDNQDQDGVSTIALGQVYRPLCPLLAMGQERPPWAHQSVYCTWISRAALPGRCAQ